MLVLDEPVLHMVRTVLAQSDPDVTAEAVQGDLLARLERGLPDLLIVDLDHTQASRPRLIEKLTARHPDIQVVCLATSDDPDRIQAAMRDGARGYFVKGFELDELPVLLDLVHRPTIGPVGW
jgi:two-component system nitrate/nitrite response regulator NarL